MTLIAAIASARRALRAIRPPPAYSATYDGPGIVRYLKVAPAATGYAMVYDRSFPLVSVGACFDGAVLGCDVAYEGPLTVVGDFAVFPWLDPPRRVKAVGGVGR